MFATKPVLHLWVNRRGVQLRNIVSRNVIVVGLSFLNNAIVTIDIDEEKLWIQT